MSAQDMILEMMWTLEDYVSALGNDEIVEAVIERSIVSICSIYLIQSADQMMWAVLKSVMK